MAVRGRPTAFAGLQPVGVHADAHRASGLAPVEPRGAQYGVDALRLRLPLDQPRTGDDHRADVRRDAPAAHDVGDDTQILDPAVGSTADEDPVERGSCDILPRRQSGRATWGERVGPYGEIV